VQSVENMLKEELNLTVTRVSGNDRYGTSLEIARYFEGVAGAGGSIPTGHRVAALATGENFPDALAGASLAAKNGCPVLLVKKEQINAEIRAYLSGLNLEKLYIYGGSGVISDRVKEEVSLK